MSQPIDNLDTLEDVLSTPTERLVEVMRELGGDIVLLGVGGKMGPSMARMAKRAAVAAGTDRRVIGVSRFSDESVRRRLESWGVETIRCDLLDEDQLDRLPAADNVVLMTGMKFGTAEQAARTWAMNCYLPALVGRRYPGSRTVAFSTGNVYGMVAIDSGGSRVGDPLDPHGEYAMSALGRERIYEYCCLRWNSPTVILRLNYATELRYGVLVDLARQVHSGHTIDLSMGHVNVIWLADANAMALTALAHVSTPARLLNLAGPEILSVEHVCRQLAQLMQLPAQLAGQPASQAYLNNAHDAYPLLGRPQVDADQMIRWTAQWVKRDGQYSGKPTQFQVRDGKF